MWFLFSIKRSGEFWLVPREAVIDDSIKKFKTAKALFSWPEYRHPQYLELMVDLGAKGVHMLGRPVFWTGLTGETKKKCLLLFYSSSRQEVVDLFHTCLRLALSSTAEDVDWPDNIQSWLERKDQDEIAKKFARKGMAEWMEATVSNLRWLEGESLQYVPDDEYFEQWRVPTEQTPVKFTPPYTTDPSVKAKPRVRLLL